MAGELVEYPFNVGLDEGTDPRRTPKFLAVQNYVWTKKGRLEKRNGYTTAPTLIATAQTPGTSSVASVTITNGGSGYTAAAAIYTVSGVGSGGGTGFLAAGGEVAGVVTIGLIGPDGHGYGFTSTPTLVVVPGPSGGGLGSGATATATLGPPAPAASSLSATYTYRQTLEGGFQVTDGSNVYTDSPDGWRAIGPLQDLNVTTRPTPLTVQEPTSTTSANPIDWYVVKCGTSLVWWTTAGPLVQDIATSASIPTNLGVHVLDGGVKSTGNVITDGTRWAWRFDAPASANTGVLYYPLDMSQPTPIESSVQAIGFGVGATFPAPFGGIVIDNFFDAQWNPVTSKLNVAYVAHSGNQITVAQYTWNDRTLQWDSPVTLGTHVISATAYRLGCISLSIADDGHYLLAWGYSDLSGTGNTVVRAVAEFNSAFTIYSASTPNVCFAIINISIAQTSGNSLSVAFTSSDQIQTDGAGASPPIGVLTTCTHSFNADRSGVVSSTTVTNGAILASRIYIQDGAPHALLLSGPGRSTVIANIDGVDTDVTPQAAKTPGIVLAYLNPSVSFSGIGDANDVGKFLRSAATLPTAVHVDTNAWILPTTLSDEPGTSTIMQLQRCDVTYGVGIRAPVTAQTSLFYPASVPAIVGTTARTAQFLAPPVIMTRLVNQAGVHGNLSAGVYTYVATYARVADDGSITESQPSNAMTVTVAASDSVSVYVTDYSLGGLADFNVGTTVAPNTKPAEYVLLYRSLANQGDNLYRVAADPFTNGAANYTQWNALRFLDQASDTAIAANPQLYTDGGVFANVSPPAITMAARVRDRIWAAGTPDGFTLYYSDAVTSLGHANFHDEQQLVLDDAGPITAISPIDANVVVFKETTAYVIYGTEGSNTGAGNTLSVPVELATGGIGCISQASVVYTSNGVMFQSRRGIELLDRSLAVAFIGEPVKAQTAGKTIVAAVLVPEQYQVRFYCNDWTTIVMSTLNGEWTIFSYAGKPTATMSDAVNVNGAVYFCGNGHLMQETPGVYSDNGSPIVAFWQSGWITLGQLEGYRRYRSLQLLGQWFSETSIEAFVQTDYLIGTPQTASWTSTEIAAFPEFDGGRVQLEIIPALQKAEAVSVTLIDTGPSDGAFTQGIGWEALSFEVAVKQGRYRKLSDKASR